MQRWTLILDIEVNDLKLKEYGSGAGFIIEKNGVPKISLDTNCMKLINVSMYRDFGTPSTKNEKVEPDNDVF